MKKILPLISLFLICSNLGAQEARFIIGVDLTASTTNHWGDFDRDYFTPVRGLYPGFNFEYLFQNQFSIKSGLAYEEKGISYEGTASNISGSETWSYSRSIYYEYISIPILISYTTKGVVRFYINGGIFGCILLNRVEEEYSDRDNELRVWKTKDYSAKYDLGLSIGAGINKNIGKRFIVDLGFRENLGFINLIDNEYSSSILRTNSFGIVAAVKIRI